MPVTVAGIPSMHICLDFICELVNQPQLEKQVCKNCFSRFSDSITTSQDCEQSFLFLRPVRRVDLRVCKFSLVSAASLSVGSYRCSRCQAPSCGEKRWEKRAGARERECHHPLSQIARVYIRLASFVVDRVPII